MADYCLVEMGKKVKYNSIKKEKMMTSKNDNLSKILKFQGKSKILEAVRGIHVNNALRAAMKLDLFSLLEKFPLTAEEIKNQLKLNGRGLVDFLDTLVSLGFLTRDGNEKNAQYSNTEEISLFLTKSSPQYIGWSFEEKMQELEQKWGELTTALKTGKPQRKDIQETGKALFELTYDSDKKKQIFVEGMNFGQLASFNDFATKFDFSPYNTLCDVGGSNALFSIIVACHNKHMNFISFDLPDMEPIAQEKIAGIEVGSRIKIEKGNFFEDEFPRADVITMGNILHDWDLETKQMLVNKAYSALSKGGALVIIESLIDDKRRNNTAGLLMSLNMLLLTEGGYDFTPADFSKIAKKIGFKKTKFMPLSGDSDAVIAYK
jgi:hypothetical protein